MSLTKRRMDITNGALLPSIVKFAIPLMLASVIQILFNAVDIIVLGHMADTNAVASVGVTGAVTSLLINAFIGFSTGTNIILARFLGAKDRDNVRKTVDTSIISAAVIGTVIGIVGLFVSPLLLAMIECPAECWDGAALYLRIYLCATPAILVYNFGAEVLRVSGDTQRPLIYMLAAGLLNVVLNFILCVIMPQKVAAVAIATVASQILGAILVLRRLCCIDNACRIDLRRPVFAANLLSRILRFGLPIALHTALFPLANLQIQSAINSFGYAAVAGNAAAVNVEMFIASITGAFGNSALTFIGQNLGADNRPRVKRAFGLCVLLGGLFGLVLGTVTYLFGRTLLVPFVGQDAAAIEYGMIRAAYIILFYWIGALNGIFGNVLQAFGYSVLTSLNSIFSVFIFRVIWMNVVYPLWPTYENVFQCFLVSWCILFTLNISMIIYVFGRYRRGKLQRVI